jgi:hypothetical protein
MAALSLGYSPHQTIRYHEDDCSYSCNTGVTTVKMSNVSEERRQEVSTTVTLTVNTDTSVVINEADAHTLEGIFTEKMQSRLPPSGFIFYFFRSHKLVHDLALSFLVVVSIHSFTLSVFSLYNATVVNLISFPS